MRLALFVLLASFGCAAPINRTVETTQTPSPPVAKVIQHEVHAHQQTRLDPYFWLRERGNSDVLSYLEAENTYADVVMTSSSGLQNELYEEMVARTKEDDSSAPYRQGGYLHYSETQKGKNYEIHHRALPDGSHDSVVLDENIEAANSPYFAAGVVEFSPNDEWLAYSADRLGNERYVMKFRNLNTGIDLPEEVRETYYSAAWSKDSTHIFYTRVDEANRPFQVWRHKMGVDDDQLVFEEKDESFHLSVQSSRSGEFIFIQLQSAVTTEYWAIDANEPTHPPLNVIPRAQGVEYYVDHSGPYFYILTNENAQNFRLLRAEVTQISEPGAWETVLAHDPELTLSNITGFEKFIVIEQRRNGITSLQVKWHDGRESSIPFSEPSYTAGLRDNFVYGTSVVRYRYSSLVTPKSTYDFDVATNQTSLVKQDSIHNYAPEKYTTERIFAQAEDGTKVPISLVYRIGARDSGPAPVYMTGYGAYGISYDPYFSSSRISLLDRGVIFAIAHVRGGGDMGRNWYETGKLLTKRNTFTDFIACSEFLEKSAITNKDLLAIEGSSAGGMLIGAVVNMRPDLFQAAVAGVPFVDVLNTMSDATLPLTVIEWEEWGNPADRTYFDYILSYSPYDNIKAQDYPAMLITAGLNDPRVQYWEPAKWVAKLRTFNTSSSPILFKTNMGAGHGGASGRYDYLRETAFEYAFVLEQLQLQSPAKVIE